MVSKEIPPQTREPANPAPLAVYYDDSENGYRKLAEMLLSDPTGYYTLAVTDSTIAYRFGVWTATHKVVPSAWMGLGKKKLRYVELLAQRPGGFCFAYGATVRPRCITLVLTMRDPFPGGPK